MNIESIAFKGIIGEIVHTKQPDGRTFEVYRRPPGTRLVIVSNEGNILITREFRKEIEDYDLRLPGGKVCDSLEEYNKLLLAKRDLQEVAKTAAIKEALEETGLIVKDPELITIAVAGATVEWDLYYYLIREYEKNETGQKLEAGEDIEVMWMNLVDIQTAISNGRMKEWRSVGVLLGLILPNKLN